MAEQHIRERKREIHMDVERLFKEPRLDEHGVFMYRRARYGSWRACGESLGLTEKAARNACWAILPTADEDGFIYFAAPGEADVVMVRLLWWKGVGEKRRRYFFPMNRLPLVREYLRVDGHQQRERSRRA